MRPAVPRVKGVIRPCVLEAFGPFSRLIAEDRHARLVVGRSETGGPLPAVTLLNTGARTWPLCPDGHRGGVTAYGFRWRKDKLFARPVYRCKHKPCDATRVRRRRPQELPRLMSCPG